MCFLNPSGNNYKPGKPPATGHCEAGSSGEKVATAKLPPHNESSYATRNCVVAITMVRPISRIFKATRTPLAKIPSTLQAIVPRLIEILKVWKGRKPMVVPMVGIILPQVHCSRAIECENRSNEHQAAATALQMAYEPTI